MIYPFRSQVIIRDELGQWARRARRSLSTGRRWGVCGHQSQCKQALVRLQPPNLPQVHSSEKEILVSGNRPSGVGALEHWVARRRKRVRIVRVVLLHQGAQMVANAGWPRPSTSSGHHQGLCTRWYFKLPTHFCRQFTS